MKKVLKKLFFKKITITYIVRISGKRVKKTFAKHVFVLVSNSYAVSKMVRELSKDRKIIIQVITIK